MPAELGYWDIRGLAQHIRILLHHVGEEFVDKKYSCGPAPDYDRSAWLNVKDTMDLDFPNLPYYIDGDVKLTQSNTIVRYIATKHDLLGKTAKERMYADIMENVAMDIRNGFVRMCYNPKFAELKPDYMNNLPGKLKQLSKFLAKNGNVWFCGENLTFPDFHMYEMLSIHLELAPNCLDDYDNLKQFMARFEALPKVKAYMASADFMKSPINNKMAAWGGTTTKA